MKTNFAIYLAAVALVKTGAGTLTVEGLKKDIQTQQDVVNKANEAVVNETDATKRIAAQLVAKNEADTLAEKMTALSLLQNESCAADKIVDENKSQIRAWGFLTHDTVKVGSIADCVAWNRKSWFSRVF